MANYYEHNFILQVYYHHSQITFIQGKDDLGNPNATQEGSGSLLSLVVATVTTFGSQRPVY